tara:strand:+ start:4552 stop:4926 length:375 start_codon:yes stop_codon:yes gene_type:complete
MLKEETKFWHEIRNHKSKISWTRLENSAAHGTPDLLGYTTSGTFFTVELKLKKVKKISFSPHQISFHLRHKKNTFIMVKDLPKALDPLAIKLYEGTKIRELRNGDPAQHVACGLDACCLFLERL